MNICDNRKRSRLSCFAHFMRRSVYIVAPEVSESKSGSGINDPLFTYMLCTVLCGAKFKISLRNMYVWNFFNWSRNQL